MASYIYSKSLPHSKKEHYDLVILGGGPAGLTAAIFAVRYTLKTLVIAKKMGGTAAIAGEVENWPGLIGSGKEIMDKFKAQAEKFGAELFEAEVDNVEKDENGFVLEIKDKEIHCKSLIIALGTENLKLNVEGEKEFLGKGVSYCAVCDGNFFKDKIVAVVGGANAAAKAALYLSDLAKKVYIVYRREKMRCEPTLFNKIKNKKNIEIYYNSVPLKILGDKKVSGFEIEQSEGKKANKINLAVDGIFVEIGATPVNEVVKSLGLKMEKDYIVVDREMKTNVLGVFAAGDNTNGKLKQIVTAAAEGAVAATSAYDYLKSPQSN